MVFYDELMGELDADFLVIQHKVLHRQLQTLCSQAGVVFRYTSAQKITQTKDGAKVDLSDNSTLDCDIVIGADGHRSFARSYISDEDSVVEHIVTSFIFLRTDYTPIFVLWLVRCKRGSLTIWMASGSSIVKGEPIREIYTKARGDPLPLCHRKTYNISICSPTLVKDIASDCSNGSQTMSSLPLDISGFDPRVLSLINRATGFHLTVQKVLKETDIVGFNGRLILVGDAAHSVLLIRSPKIIQIEDAATLGRLFARFTGKSQISALTEAYAEIRRERTKKAQISEYEALVQISLADAKAQDVRNKTLLQTLQATFEMCRNDESLAAVWKEYLDMFGFDTDNAVDQWWWAWG
ncbi:FAD-binding-3 domain-containing protein, partial [Favolaschia claudopus]